MRTANVLGVLFLISCGSAPELGSQVVVSDELPRDALIVLQRGACERRCPVYNVAIFADGSVVFDGRSYVAKPGLAKTNVSREAAGKLLAQAAALKFFDLPGNIEPGVAGCPAVAGDAPTVTLTVSARGRAKTVIHQLGCQNGDGGKLQVFEQNIDKAINTARWVK